jgi:tyrosine-protein kinase Etk/Wzc
MVPVQQRFEQISATMPRQIQNAGTPEMSEFLAYAAFHKRLIGVVTGVALIGGIALALLFPPRFVAVTKIMTPQQTQSTAIFFMNQNGAGGAASLAAAAGSGMSLKNPNDLYIGLLSSRTVQDAIIRKFGLMQSYRAKDMTAARKKLMHFTSIESDKSGILSITVRDRDKKRAADLANAYPEQLRFLTGTLAATEASQRRVFYEEQLKRAKDDLVAAEVSFQQVQQQKGLVQFDAQARATIQSLAELHAQVAAKQVELQALRSYSTDQNPAVQLAQNQLASLQAEADRLEQRNRTVGTGGMGLQDLVGAGIGYLQAQHEVQYRQALFDLLIKQYDAAKLDEAKQATIIQVVDEAIPAEHMDLQYSLLTVLLVTALGFLSGITYLYFRREIEWKQKSGRSLAEFKGAMPGINTDN